MTKTIELPDFSDLKVIQIKVPIFGTDYLLVEASGDAAVKFRNATMEAMVVKDGKVAGYRGAANVEPLLVSFCLHTVKEDGTPDKLVPKDLILSWPGRIQKALFAKAKEISDLVDKGETIKQVEEKLAEMKTDMEEEEEAGKNESGNTMDGSD